MGEGSYLTIRVTPRARLEKLAVEGELVHLWVTAAPEKGGANEEALALLARALAVRRADLRIASGASGRTKHVAVEGLTPDQARARLGRAGPGQR